MNLFIIGYCVGLFCTMVALANKYCKLHDEFLAIKSEQERFQSAIEALWSQIDFQEYLISQMQGKSRGNK